MGIDLKKLPPRHKICARKFADSEEQAARVIGVQGLEHVRREEHERSQARVRTTIFRKRFPRRKYVCVFR